MTPGRADPPLASRGHRGRATAARRLDAHRVDVCSAIDPAVDHAGLVLPNVERGALLPALHGECHQQAGGRAAAAVGPYAGSEAAREVLRCREIERPLPDGDVEGGHGRAAYARLALVAKAAGSGVAGVARATRPKSAAMTIYLDHAATTPLRPEVLAAMLPLLTEDYGNPSSPHSVGRRARAALDEAHDLVARSIGADAREVVFTSGGTEAINLGIKGAAWAGKATGNRIVTSAVRTPGPCWNTCSQPREVRLRGRPAAVDRYGRVDPPTARARRSPTGRAWSHSSSPTTRWAPSPTWHALVLGAEFARGSALIHVDAVQAAP